MEIETNGVKRLIGCNTMASGKAVPG